MKRNEIHANQIHEIYEMADKSPQLQCRQISELLDACIALLPLQFSTQSSLAALLLSSHLHSPHSVPLLSNSLSNCGHSIQPPHMQQTLLSKKLD
jgi:hypothetical protein